MKANAAFSEHTLKYQPSNLFHENAATYSKQIFKILDNSRTEVRNGVKVEQAAGYEPADGDVLQVGKRGFVRIRVG